MDQGESKSLEIVGWFVCSFVSFSVLGSFCHFNLNFFHFVFLLHVSVLSFYC